MPPIHGDDAASRWLRPGAIVALALVRAALRPWSCRLWRPAVSVGCRVPSHACEVPRDGDSRSMAAMALVTPAIVIISGILNVTNPRLDPSVRVVWRLVLLPLAVILCGAFLSANPRERRRRREASHGT
jgi:hypothetical protein